MRLLHFLVICLFVFLFSSSVVALEPGAPLNGNPYIWGHTRVYTYGDPTSVVIRKFNDHVLEFAYNTATVSYNEVPPSWSYSTVYLKHYFDTNQYFYKWNDQDWIEVNPAYHSGETRFFRALYNYGMDKKINPEKENIQRSLQLRNSGDRVTEFFRYSGAELTAKNSNWETKAENEHKMNFLVDNNGVLHLVDLKDNKDIFSFIPSNVPAFTKNIHYRIDKIYIDDPHKEFFQIIANGGNPIRNYGYWLVGIYKGKWVTFLSKDHLYTYKFGQPYLTQNDTWSLEPEFYYDDKYPNWYPHTFFLYDRKNRGDDAVTNFTIQIFWDKYADWIGVKPVSKYARQYVVGFYPKSIPPEIM